MKTEIEEFVKSLNEKFPKQYEHSEEYIAMPGRKLTRIALARNDIANSAYAFIDQATGELYKAISWGGKSPVSYGNITNKSTLDNCQRFSLHKIK
jgi:hypothetical protein